VIVLDTHAFVWWLSDPGKLSQRARQAVNRASEEQSVWVSTISTWEIAMLVARGRLELRIPVARWIAISETLPFLRFLAPDNTILLRAVELDPSFAADPADRIIAATALHLACPLVTKDRRLRSQARLNTVW